MTNQPETTTPETPPQEGDVKYHITLPHDLAERAELYMKKYYIGKSAMIRQAVDALISSDGM